MFRCFGETIFDLKKDLFAQTHALARTMSNPDEITEALEATHLNVEVDDPKLYHGNCVDVIANKVADGSVDLVLNDPPYGVTDLGWDSQPVHEFFPNMWEEFERILKPTGIVIMFSQGAFTVNLIKSAPKKWNYYTLVFEKYNMSNPTQANYGPLRWHEDIVVFYRGTDASKKYNRDQVKRVKKTWGGLKNQGMGVGDNNLRDARSILPIFALEKIIDLPKETQNENHSTRKPVKALEWILDAYSNYGDVVLDFTMGSGSTGVACVNKKRNFIGIELCPNAELNEAHPKKGFADKYFDVAKDRILLAMRKQLFEEDEVSAERVPVVMPPLRNKFNPKEFNAFLNTINPEAYEPKEIIKYACDYIDQYFKIVVDKDLKVIEYEFEVFEDGSRAIIAHKERSEAGAKARFSKSLIDGKNVFDAFKPHPDYAMYDSMSFDPTAGALIEFPEDGHLNTFYGYRAEVISMRMKTSQMSTESNIEFILDHVLELCGENKDYYEYLMDVLAYPIQTGEKSEVAILQRGGQGSGKGAFYKDFLINKVYGKVIGLELAGGIQVGANFNSLLAHRCLIVIDEPNEFSAARRNILKNSITSDDMEVKTKYVNEKIENDYSNYVFTCNDVPEDLLEHDDRRFFCIEATGKHTGNKKYFDELFEAFNDEATVAAFFQMLKTREIKLFAKGEHPPQTKIKERILCATIDPIFRYLRHMVDTGLVPAPMSADDSAYTRNFKPQEARKMLRTDFYAKCLKFCEERRLKPSWKGKSMIVFETIILDKFQKFFGTGFTMFKQARVEGKSLPCVIFPDPDALYEWLERAKVLQTEDELETELETQQSLDSMDLDELIKIQEDTEKLEQDNAMKRKQLLEMDQIQVESQSDDSME